MKKLNLLIILISTFGIAQNDSISNKYLEDQFYIGITYNTLNKVPEGINQNGFSNGLSFGFIKDISVNQQGDFAFGLGLGYGRNTYFQNLKIFEVDENTLFEKVSDFSRNKFSLHTVELPIEIRWRRSTIDRYKFWRIYTGVKLAYVFASNAKLKKDGETIKVRGISSLEKLQYGLTVGAGYGTWNLNVYYGLSDIFDATALFEDTNTPVRGRDLRIGLIFYIL